jgi:hypothetical protein
MARWKRGVVGGVAVMVAVSWLAPNRGARNALPQVTPRPAATSRARPPPRVAVPAPDGTLQDTYVSLRLTDPQDDRPLAAGDVGHAPWLYWPGLDEADWPDLETAEAMDLLVEELRADADDLRAPVEAFVAAAEADGLLPLPDDGFEDPWTGLMAAQATYASLYLDDEASEAEQIARVEARMNQVQRILDEAPDHEAAPLAALILADSLAILSDEPELFGLGFGLESDGAIDLVPLLTEVLHDAQDPAVVWEAAARLSLLPGGEAALDEIEAALPRAGEYASTLARGGLGLALRDGRFDEAIRWVDRLEQLPSSDEGDLDEVDRIRGMLAARGLIQPDNWRVELYAAAWACADDVPADGDLVEVRFEVREGAWSIEPAAPPEPDRPGAEAPPQPLVDCLAPFSPAQLGPSEARIVFRLGWSA